MVVNRNRKITFGIILSDYILVQIFFNLLGLGNILQTEVAGGARRLFVHMLLHNLVCLSGTVATDKAVDS
jgi:hypothetical protein